MMGVFNNLIMFDQHVAQNSLQSIVPDLATSWAWNEEGTELTFQLQRGVKWHDGEPFTARDVKCTWDLRMDHKPPFDNPEIRRAITLSIDRQAFVDTIAQGEGQVGGVLQPPPEGLWSMPPDEVQILPGYSPDVENNRAAGRQIMRLSDTWLYKSGA
jgi:peptide/nickel transport system substrate-binding protein